MTGTFRPQSRSEGVIVEHLPGETLVYDEKRDSVHCLSGAAAKVFELCDGKRSMSDLAQLASLERREVENVLDELRAKELLAEPGGLSRRQVLIAGGAAATVPLITTIVAPVPAAAQSPTPGSPGASCNTPAQCNPGLECANGVCCIPSGESCSTDESCCSGVCSDSTCAFLSDARMKRGVAPVNGAMARLRQLGMQRR